MSARYFTCIALLFTILFYSSWTVFAVNRQATSTLPAVPSPSCALQVEQSWSCFHDIQRDVEDILQEISGKQPIEFGPSLQSCTSK